MNQNQLAYVSLLVGIGLAGIALAPDQWKPVMYFAVLGFALAALFYQTLGRVAWQLARSVGSTLFRVMSRYSGWGLPFQAWSPLIFWLPYYGPWHLNEWQTMAANLAGLFLLGSGQIMVFSDTSRWRGAVKQLRRDQAKRTREQRARELVGLEGQSEETPKFATALLARIPGLGYLMILLAIPFSVGVYVVPMLRQMGLLR